MNRGIALFERGIGLLCALDFRLVWLDYCQISRRVRMHAEIPHVTIYALLAEQFRNCVLARFERRLRSELDPAFTDLLGGCRNYILLLSALSVYCRLDCAHNSFIAFYLCFDDSKSVPRQLK